MLKLLKNIVKFFLTLILVVVVGAACVLFVPNGFEYATSSMKMDSVKGMTQQVKNGDHDFDAILVLGAAVYPDGTPSTILADRLDVAIKLYKKGVAPKIIMSGDNREANYNECYNMKTYAINKGVPSADVFCDHRGVCTYDSMYRAKHVFGVKSMCIVTQSYHMYRAIFDAAGMGIDAWGVPSDTHEYLDQDYYDKREFLARINDFKKVIMRENAEFLSEPVSLDQSGDVTYW